MSLKRSRGFDKATSFSGLGQRVCVAPFCLQIQHQSVPQLLHDLGGSSININVVFVKSGEERAYMWSQASFGHRSNPSQMILEDGQPHRVLMTPQPGQALNRKRPNLSAFPA